MGIILLALLICLVLTPKEAMADIEQLATTSIKTGTCVESEQKFGFGFVDVTSSLVCPSARAFAANGKQGNIALSAQQTTAGQVLTSAEVFAEREENENPLPIPLRAEAKFVIDGGNLLFDGAGTIDFDINLVFRVFERTAVLPKSETLWNTGGTLTGDFSGPPTLSLRGEDIGITQTGFNVDIPLTFIVLDLGIIPARGDVSISYEATFKSDLPRVEGAFWSFSDPGNISGVGDFPIITFDTPPGGEVPEPATLTLLGIGIVALVVRQYRRTLRKL
jgi:hypothetical protein